MTSSRRSIGHELNDAELRALVQLRLLPGLPDERLTQLLSCYHPVSLIESARRGLLGEPACRALGSPKYRERIERALGVLHRCDVSVIAIGDDQYPQSMLALGEFAPAMLFCRGRTELLQADRAIAVIGARDSTEYGDSVAELFAIELARRGVTVISGLARGIDGIAHESALSAGGDTIAVLGCGIDVYYPPRNARLQERIAEEGLLISEFAPDCPAYRKNFPQRNRLIALLSSGVLVVEAGVKSGTRKTVDWALNHNVEVFAVPGPIGRYESQGTNEIIQDGGHLVTSIRDVFEVLHWHEPAATDGDDVQAACADPTLRALYARIPVTGVHVDDLAQRAGLSVADALTQLTQLELEGLVAQKPGKRFARVLARHSL